MSSLLAPSPLLPPGATRRAMQRLAPAENRYLHDPNGWRRDRLGEAGWSKQDEIGESVVRNRYTAVPSSHDVGKSFKASRLACWWLEVHPPGEAFVVSTAPTQPQVDAILWREIRAAHRKGRLNGEISPRTAAWYMGEDELVAFGRKPADYADPERAKAAFQGIHARYVLIILDEGSGIPQWLFDGADTLATNENARVVALGNPDDPTGAFAKVCKPGSGWNVIPIDGLQSPNFNSAACAEHPWLAELLEDEGLEPNDEEIPDSLRQLLLSPDWVKERLERWGLGSPLWESKVRGRFPDVSDDTLISPGMVRRGHETELAGLEPGLYGADVARYGADETVVYRNRGGQVRHVASAAKQDTMATAGMFALLLKQHHVADRVPMVIDVVGVGAGVYDRLREQGLPVYPFNAGEKAIDQERFANRRAEVYWALAREGLERGEIDLDPADDELANQLQSIKWKTDSKGRILIESKEDMRRRGVPSPDRADAFVQSLVSRPAMALPANDPQPTLTGDLLERAL
jgi:hypothetical protein